MAPPVSNERSAATGPGRAMGGRGWIHRTHQRPAAAAGRAVADGPGSLGPLDSDQRCEKQQHAQQQRGHASRQHGYLSPGVVVGHGVHREVAGARGSPLQTH